MRVTGSDGVPLNVVATDMRYDRTVIFVNALGISCRVAEPLMAELYAHQINFATWDIRGSPGAGEDFRAYRMSHHVDDLAVIVEACCPTRMVLAAWCSGGPVALCAVAQERVKPVSMAVFCAPNYHGEPRPEMARNVLAKTCSAIARDETKLGFYYDAIVAKSDMDRLTDEIHDKRLQRYVLENLQSGPQAWLRYAHAINNRATADDVTAWCAAIQVPTTFYGAKKDRMVSYQDSIALSNATRSSKYKIYDDWNHYSLFQNVRTAAAELASMF